jgi:beta-mannosidase
MNRISLNNKWQFALDNSSFELIDDKMSEILPGKYYKAQVPGTIHTDLLNNNLIVDPFYSDNEKELGWIAECNWIYRKEFILNNDSGAKYNLVFDGVDTISEIYFNDILIGETNNMFLRYKFDVTDQLKEGINKVKILLRSPNYYSKSEESKYDKLPVALNSNRVYLRKAQYSFGWDWGPIFTTSGIWKDVYLEEKSDSEIESFTFNTLSIKDNSAEVEIKTVITNNGNSKLNLIIKLQHENSVVEKQINNCKNAETIRLNLPSPQLWFPNGEGEQKLYNLSIQLVNHKKILLSEINKLVGIRTIELVNEEDGKPQFAFKVNGKKIYCKGSNWIPADTFLPRVSNDKYYNLLNKAKNANMNIVRVWGGGIYENDIFYEYCDKLGLLVWQDFMFACGAYPEHEEFINIIQKEVSQNIYRLQHHSSLAIWCGNNENEWGWYQQNDSSYKEMPGYRIYHFVIPDIIKEIDPGRAYWPSSPFGSENDPNSQLSGNTHQWGIWSSWIDYFEVKSDQSLFVTEFGFQGPANINTWKKALPKKNRKFQDDVFEFHNKQVEGPERIFKFLSSHLPIKNKWKDYLYLTQLNQGLALKTCIEHWRTNEKSNGSIIWQLNDCWPVTSWSLIDSELAPKMAYHFVKNVFSQVFVKFNGNNICTIYNHSNDLFNGTLKIVEISLPKGKVIEAKEYIISMPANEKFEVSLSNSALVDENKSILVGTVYDNNDEIIHRNYQLNKKWKNIQLPKCEIECLSESKNDKDIVKIRSNSLSLFVDLYHPNLTFNTRGLIMLPEEEIEIEFEGTSKEEVNINKIKIYCLNNYLGKK